MIYFLRNFFLNIPAELGLQYISSEIQETYTCNVHPRHLTKHINASARPFEHDYVLIILNEGHLCASSRECMLRVLVPDDVINAVCLVIVSSQYNSSY